MKKILFLFFPFFLTAQDTEIGSWKNYLCYNNASYIADAKTSIYCVATGSVFFVDKQENTLNRLSKTNGLSDVRAKQVVYCEDLDVVVIVYENCNIDVIKKNQTINISDIKRKEIAGNKKINNITLRDNIMYLSCSFGLVLVDLEKEEIKDTYNIGEEDNTYEINGCGFWGDSIIVATSGGVLYANYNSSGLSDYNNWSVFPGYENAETYDNIVNTNNGIFIDTSKEIKSINYSNNKLIKSKFNTIEIVANNGSSLELTNINFKNILYALCDGSDDIWVADSINGLLRFSGSEYQESYVPNGPVRNEIYSLKYEGDRLYQCHGGHANFGTNSLINSGASIKDKYDNWVNYDRYQLGNARDILSVAVKNGTEYYASWYHGIIEMKNGELIIKYGFTNTNGALDTTYYSNNRIRISDLKFDSYGNMWALSSEVNHPIVVKTLNNEWYSFSMNQNQVDLFFDDLLIDRYNQKWGVLAQGNGLVVFTDNNTIENPNDDQYKIINTNIGSGDLPSMQTYSLVEDLKGAVWVGTDKGVAVFYDPSTIFTEYNFDAEQILITEGDYGQYLLSEEKIKCIAVDGANRKWVGTEKSGLFLLSEDGREEILHFTANNSPLFSNNIVDIAINNNNGEVFVGTANGVISYRSNATQGASHQENTKVFPNPVKETYSGPIAISGLVSNANVKITNIVGDLVFQTTANGGQAIWDGKNKEGKRAATGVYLVFSVDVYGNEKAVSKILFIK